MPVISTIAAATARAFGAFKSAAGGAADEFFNYVTLLLHGDGTNGAQNNTFLDSSTNNFTITRNGNTTQGTFSPFSQTGWSGFFDGSGDSISFTGTAVGTDDITFEAWIYPTAGASSTYYALIDARTSGSPTTGFAVYAVGTGSAATIEVWGSALKGSSASGAISLNTWTHVSVLRTSGTCQVYVNGSTSGSSFTFNDNWTATARIVGTNSGGSLYPFAGYMSNMRLVDGTAIVPTAGGNSALTNVSGTDFLILQSNRFVDNSSNSRALTIAGNTSVQAFSPFAPTAAYSAATVGGSGYFDGSGDYLVVGSGASLGVGSGDFTIELWWYPTAWSSDAEVFSAAGNSGTNRVFAIYTYNSNGTLGAYAGTGGANWDIISNLSIGTAVLNQWNHIAFTRSGSTFSAFLNGVRTATTTSSGTLGSTDIGVGARTGGQAVVPASWMSNARVVAGTALYTGTTYTVPTAPFTAISGTTALLNFTNGGIIDNTAKNVLETVGNAQISTSVKKFGTGSLAFDGTGDYLVAKMTPNIAFGSGDMTIECWVYLNSITGFDTIFDTRVSGAYGTDSFSVYVESGVIKVYSGSVVGELILAGTSALTTGVWTHIAFSRSGGTNRIFVGGQQQSSNTTSWNQTFTSTNLYYIGETIGGGRPFDGYIDDLRITKGVARYTANFTPPTEAFPDL